MTNDVISWFCILTLSKPESFPPYLIRGRCVQEEGLEKCSKDYPNKTYTTYVRCVHTLDTMGKALWVFENTNEKPFKLIFG